MFTLSADFNGILRLFIQESNSFASFAERLTERFENVRPGPKYIEFPSDDVLLDFLMATELLVPVQDPRVGLEGAASLHILARCHRPALALAEVEHFPSFLFLQGSVCRCRGLIQEQLESLASQLTRSENQRDNLNH